jgi:hypothetical protein
MWLLAALGIMLRLSVRRRLTGESHGGHPGWLGWPMAAVLALAVVPSTLHYGVGVFASSICQDAWNYIAAADFFSHFARGSESAGSPLDQYGSMFMNARNASSVLLAFLATGLGVTAAEVISLYCLLVLFAHSCALVAFGRTIFGDLPRTLAFTLLAGFAVPLLIVTYANLDQMLILPFLPLLAALACKVGRGEGIIAASLAIGMVLAASIFTYVEMAVLAVPVALTFAVAPGERFSSILNRALGGLAVAIPVTLLLSWPGLASLIGFFKSQYAIATQAGFRPGDGALSTWLVSGAFLQSRWLDAIVAVAAACLAVVASGVWFERRRWMVVSALGAVSGLVLYFLVVEHYIYAVYKVASVNFWMVSFFVVAGAYGLLRYLSYPKWSFRVAPSAALAFTALLMTLAAAGLEVRLRGNAIHQLGYREAVALADKLGASPTLLSVRDEAANQWAVFYLADVPLIVDPYRSTMAQPEVRAIMNRARRIDPASVRFVVTDHDMTIRSEVIGGHLAWDGGTYSLWELDGGNWSVTAEGGPINDHVHLSGPVKAQEGTLSEIDPSNIPAISRR